MRFLLFFALVFSLLFAQEEASTKEKKEPSTEKKSQIAPKGTLIAGIAITVNGDPITLYQIKQTAKEQKLTEEKAIDFLVAQKIKEQEIKRLKINIDEEKIDNEIQNMAYRNGMDTKTFLSAIKKEQHMSEREFKKHLKEQMETQELMRSVLMSNGNSAGEEEMRDYYNKHRGEFNMPKEVLVVRYSAKSSELLEEAIKHPDTAMRGVERVQEKMSLASLAPQIGQVFATTKINEFTTILNAGNNTFVTFLIKEKIGEEQITFQQAKNFITQKLIEKRQDKILEDHFEKIKQKASIITLRK
ncbi:SurA N-terminal domain-containing protein [Helicobacter mustelae]|uniref:Putative periplasmic protein n=1 Tax=Helicobacter mustelae (strain ATCC 43772 / CCUG 25715 / CIP 103759 / LMG 18044 / NCTC 12198 / R85-136P) TaxID=679897 RepID=D3UJ49_HELM1|nr:SurA N-terminal domain-containing protein [Helicobacter mustelae]CBG40524.1 putative periplasmic protein [Helicobacter mustelae 12198]SQH72022.1 SurA domain-containing protein [Helicobacter mustelae]STP13165.1 SurA domain-containing protein [Helicobacter mustelae]